MPPPSSSPNEAPRVVDGRLFGLMNSPGSPFAVRRLHQRTKLANDRILPLGSGAGLRLLSTVVVTKRRSACDLSHASLLWELSKALEASSGMPPPSSPSRMRLHASSTAASPTIGLTTLEVRGSHHHPLALLHLFGGFARLLRVANQASVNGPVCRDGPQDDLQGRW
jgi:hypothetical protein